MYTCPNCGSDMLYDVASKKLKCSHCETLIDIKWEGDRAEYELDGYGSLLLDTINTQYSVENIDNDNKELSAEEIGKIIRSDLLNTRSESGGHPLRTAEQVQDEYEATVFSCPQCGGIIKTVGTAIVDFCPYCGSTSMLSGRLQREKKPDYIIPFSKTKEECAEIYKARVEKAWCVPSRYKDMAKVSQINGIFLPYWVYSVHQNGQLTFKYADKENSRGKVSCYFEKSYNYVLYDAASSFSDPVSEDILDYDRHDFLLFNPAYLSGFYADNADVDKEKYMSLVQEKSCQMTNQIIENKILEKYKDLRNVHLADPKNLQEQFNSRITGVKEAMLPVWLLTWREKDSVVHAAINGKTGKSSTRIPVDLKQFALHTVMMIVPVILFVYILLSALYGVFGYYGLEDYIPFLFPIHSEVPAVLWTEIFTLLGTGVLYCKAKEFESAAAIDGNYMRKHDSDSAAAKGWKERKEEGSFYDSGYVRSELHLLSIFGIALIGMPVFLRLLVSFCTIFFYDSGYTENIGDLICLLIYLFRTAFMVFHIHQYNGEYVRSRRQMFNIYLLLAGIVSGWAVVYRGSFLETSSSPVYYYVSLLIFAAILKDVIDNILAYNRSCGRLISDYYKRSK